MMPKATKLYEKMMSVWPERDDHFLAGLFEVYTAMESLRDLVLRFVGDIRTQLPRCARLPCDQKSIMAALDVLDVQIAEKDACYGISG